jgi:hypothetical protein
MRVRPAAYPLAAIARTGSLRTFNAVEHNNEQPFA